MNIKVYIGILVFLIWGVGCNWWYVCKIKGMCESLPFGITANSDPLSTPIQAAANTVQDAETDQASIPMVSDQNKEASTLAEMPKPVLPPETKVNFQIGTTNIIYRTTFEDYKSKVGALAATNRVQNVSVTGHTCDLGSNAYNRKLGLKRAALVKSELVDLGIDRSKINISSAGETQPLNENGSEEQRIANRRAHIIIQ